MQRLEIQDLFKTLFSYPPLPPEERTLENVSKCNTFKFNLKNKFLFQPVVLFVDLRHIDNSIYMDYNGFFRKIIFKFDLLGCLRQAMSIGVFSSHELDLDEAYRIFDRIYKDLRDLYYKVDLNGKII